MFQSTRCSGYLFRLPLNDMKSLFQRSLIFVSVVAAAWLGMATGQLLTRRVVAISIAQAAPESAELEAAKDRYKNLELFQKVLSFVESNYVEEVKHKDLIFGAIKGMMATLDPHSNFLPPDIYKDMKVDTTGKFGGLGIEIGLRDGVLTIIAPIEDTPAWKAGLKPGDRIVKIGNESTKGMNLVEAVSKMRGVQGSKVSITIFRKGFDKVRDVTLARAIIKVRSVRSELLENGYGYVRLMSFNESAASDVEKAIRTLEAKQKLNGLVFDLRTNPGGLLDQAVEVSSLFVDDGVIVSTIGRNKDQKEVKHARKGKARKDFAVAILVNSSTASAAEIVAGALQDHGRAVVLGETTFGKGSVQTVVELSKDMGLKLTVARYYTPSGRSIQEKGVEPDIVLDQYDPKLLEKAKVESNFMREKDLPGHMIGEGESEPAKKEKAGEDFSQKELETLGTTKGKTETPEDDEMAPMKFDPKNDYQVKQAVNYLKSFEILKDKVVKEKKAASL